MHAQTALKSGVETIQITRALSGLVHVFFGFGLVLVLAGTAGADAKLRPHVRHDPVPVARWGMDGAPALWSRAALSALAGHGAPLIEMVPGDIANWCPAYEGATPDDRRRFWVGFLSALARHESTYRAQAVGGGGRWFGLLQIAPATARGYGCVARTGEALKNGEANLSCAIRIMAVTVPRDGVVYGPGGRGVAADWGPLRSRGKRAEMAAWTRRLPACRHNVSLRPRLRPPR